VLDLQRAAGNTAVLRALTAGSPVVQRLSAKNTERKQWIESALTSEKWDDAETPGAYYIFNGLSTDDMIAVYNALSAAGRKSLEANLDKTGLDRARMYQAIVQAKAGSNWWREKSGQVHWAIRSGDFVGYPDGAYWIINPLNAADTKKIMTFLDRDHLDELVAHHGQAVDAGVPNADRIAGDAGQARGTRGASKRERAIADLIPGGQPVTGLGRDDLELPAVHADCSAALRALAALNDAALLRVVRSLPQEKRFTLEMNVGQADTLGLDGNRLRYFLQRAERPSEAVRADRIVDSCWQPDYKKPPGDYSHTLLASGPGNVTNTFEISIDEIGDGELTPAEVDRQWREARVGRGGLLWPAKLNMSTTPNLWAAKARVLQQIESWHGKDMLFIIQSFMAVEFVLHAGVGVTMSASMTSRPRGGGGGGRPPRKGSGGGPPGGGEPPGGSGPKGPRWGSGRKVVNLGGEGEVPDAVDFNDRSALLDKKRAAAEGSQITGDFFGDWPIPADFLDQVVGNRMPAAFGQRLNKMMSEAHRTLKPGGVLEVWTTSRGTSENWAQAARAAGFRNVEPIRGGQGIRAVK
jgi:hypothetical protein